MDDTSASRQTRAKKVNNTEVIEISTSESDLNEVSSTSLDKRPDLLNGTTTFLYHENNDLECNKSGENGGGDQHDKTEDLVNDLESMEDFVIPERTLPAYNAPEKIVIVYDSAIDEVSTGFEVNNETICPTVMLKKSLQFFMINKQLIDSKHEFALVVINDNNLVWLQDFTRQIELIMTALDEIPTCETEDILVLDDLFKLINSRVQLPDCKDNFNVPPPYVVRVLFTYGRSYTMPKFNAELEELKLLVNSPYFTFDVLMTHEMPSSTNNCIKIFKDLQQIDCKGFAYFIPVGRSASQLRMCVAKLLGHPLQRPVQRVADYTVNVMNT